MTFSTPSTGRKSSFTSSRLLASFVSILLIALLLPSCGLLNLGLIKLRFGCVPEGTCIDTTSGPVRIEDLKTGDTITGFGGSPVTIRQIHQYQEDPATSRYLDVSFSNGGSVRVSPRHRIDGVPAGDLKVGDPCGSQTVTKVGSIHGVSRSFDLLTEDAGYQICGIPVNSMIAEMLGR